MLKRFWVVALLASGCVFAYVLANSHSRLILRVQLSMFMAPPRSFTGTLESLGIKDTSILPGEAENARRALARTAARHPEDSEIQLAYSGLGGISTPEPIVERVRRVLSQFPEDPLINAAFMRYACSGSIAVRRPEESWLTGDTPSAAALA